jgi:hypothetical protein
MMPELLEQLDFVVAETSKELELPDAVRGWDGDEWVWTWVGKANRSVWQVWLRVRPEGPEAGTASVDAVAWDDARKPGHWTKHFWTAPFAAALLHSKEGRFPLSRVLEVAWREAQDAQDQLAVQRGRIESARQRVRE